MTLLSEPSGEPSHHPTTPPEPPLPDCPIAGYAWRAMNQMPDQRLPRHVSALTVILAEAQRRGGEGFEYTLSTATTLVGASRCCGNIRNPAHEVVTLHAKRNLGITFDGVLYCLDPEVAMAYVSPYLVAVSAR